MCKIEKIYKNVPGIGFFVKAGRRFAKRMEPNKFVDTNLLINEDPLKMGNAFVSRIVTDGFRSNDTHRKNYMTVYTVSFKPNSPPPLLNSPPLIKANIRVFREPTQ